MGRLSTVTGDTVISKKLSRHGFLIVGFITLVLFSPAHAATVTVSVGELNKAITSLSSEPDALRRVVLQKIQTQLNEANLVLDAGKLLINDTRDNIDTGSGCNRTEIRTLTTSIALASDTQLTLSLESLNQPILLGIELEALISATGRAKQNIGFRLGSCQDLGNDNFTFSASGAAQFSLQLELRLNPILNEAQQQLVLRPVLKLEGGLTTKNVSTDVNDSLLSSVLERVLEDQIDDALDSAKLLTSIKDLEASLKRSLENQLDNGLIVVELPSPSDEQISALYRLLSPVGDFSLSLGLLRTQRIELLGALILGDSAELSRLLSDAAQCEAAGFLQTSIAHQSVYRIDVDGCQLSQIPDADNAAQTNWYYDSACQLPLNYYPTSTVDFCVDVLDTQRLGNAASKVDQLDQWTLSPGTRFDIGALSLKGKEQPFTQRANYKSVDTDQGECQLEMRIHTVYPAGTLNPSRAIIAFHGGSWQRRSSGALGIESFATQFANEGFVVFAPFYRLIGSSEGNAECNNATLSQVLDDASDALDWVQANGDRYGVEGKPVLFGQSAGGHLAGVLSVERADEIAAAVLFYAPTDFSDFARQLIEGEIDTVTGQEILESVLDEQLETFNVDQPLVQRNTLPARIVNESIVTPPMFLVHGQKDTVLPFTQSVRLCNALSGDAETGSASFGHFSLDVDAAAMNDSLLRQVIYCDAQGSQLHLIREGEHALDLCIADELCLAGSPASAELVKDSMARMLSWVNEHYRDPLDDQGTQGSSGGSMSLITLLLMWIAALRLRGVRPELNLLVALSGDARAPEQRATE